MKNKMVDILGNELNIGDRVVFPYSKEHIAIGKIIKICDQKVRISHETLYIPQVYFHYRDGSTLRYPYDVLKIGDD